MHSVDREIPSRIEKNSNFVSRKFSQSFHREKHDFAFDCALYSFSLPIILKFSKFFG